MHAPFPLLNGPGRKKTMFYANNKGADQIVYSHSLISTFVIRYLVSIIIKRSPYNILIF